MTVRIMIADDDLLTRRALSGVLGRVGFDVHTAADGETAMQVAKLLHPQLAVIDFSTATPGLDVLRQLKQQYGDAMFVAILSSEDDDERQTRDECFAAGADAVLAKPILPTELRRLMMAAASGLGVNTAAS